MQSPEEKRSRVHFYAVKEKAINLPPFSFTLLPNNIFTFLNENDFHFHWKRSSKHALKQIEVIGAHSKGKYLDNLMPSKVIRLSSFLFFFRFFFFKGCVYF